MSGQIRLDALCAEYIETTEWGYSTTTEYPDLWQFKTSDGREWITDRYWILPEDMVEYDQHAWQPKQLPESTADKPRGWLATALSADLAPSSSRFAPTFAGVLALAGITGRAVEGEKWDVLVTADEQRVGLLMPCNPDRLDESRTPTVPLPVPESVLTAHKRVRDINGMTEPLAWRVAASVGAS